MPVTLVVGAQWGDEGKGRLVDFLSAGAEIVARFGGGTNAGHTVRVGDTTYKLRIVPSGVVAGVRHCIIGPGTVVSPAALVEELDGLDRLGIDTSRVWVSDLAHLVLPYHAELDRAQERSRGDAALGTTGKGIGPAYVDRAARCGVQAGDLRDLSSCKEAVEQRCRALRQAGAEVDPSAALRELERCAPRVLPHVRDTIALLHEALRAGKRVVAEGAQGTMLDVNLGTYPYVTSSITVAGGACSGLGCGPKEIEHVVGVVKAYATRVGSGPFPTELSDEVGDRLRERGAEYGTVTGRPRRCGWLDLPALHYAIAVSGITHLAMTKLDVLDGFEELSVCTDYGADGSSSLPYAAKFAAEPVFERLAGWKGSTSGARTFEDLPANARAYIRFVEASVGVPVSYISVGPERSQIVVRPGAPFGAVAATV